MLPDTFHSKSPDLLAPAGDWECARAAVENGADAIYFGLEKFNARMRARNFKTEDLPSLMSYLHSRGVKGYVTFNTLVFTDELGDADHLLRSIVRAGVDAAIVQDVGVCCLIRRISPDFPIHASTQMTITSAAGVEFAKGLGCNLVVLARECSIKEIESILSADTLEAPPAMTSGPAMPLEVFVHGALCVAYSGQCLTSEALGGRSANRGECAQACRLPYELVSDGRTVPLGDRRYLLSPQDLAGLEVLPQLIQAGVSSFKIEGRLKSPEYVANVTQAYRQAIDQACRPSADSALQSLPVAIQKQLRYNLEMAFSRGLHTGWLRGADNQSLVHARFGKKRGVFLGTVSRTSKTEVFARLTTALKPGDGVVFDCGDPASDEEGGRVFFADPVGTETRIKFGADSVDLKRVQQGDRIWKTSDPELDNRLRKTFAAGASLFRRPVTLVVSGSEGTPLKLTMIDPDNLTVHVESQTALARAEKRPLREAFLREQLGRMGNTPFRLEHLRLELGPNLMLPVSELNRLRRDACLEMVRKRESGMPWTLTPAPFGGAHSEILTASRINLGKTPPSIPTLIPLVRSLDQLAAVLELGHKLVYCELEDPKRYRDAVRVYRGTYPVTDASTPGPTGIFVAPPRVFKQGEDWIMKIVESSEPDGFLVRNHHHLNSLRNHRRIGDFSLNVANPLAAEYFMTHCHLERLVASYDLNALQLAALLKAAPASWFEITIHQRMPMFHMEHCVFCAFLSSGTDYTNCGRPCEKHKVSLRDRVGIEHTLKADAGCRNTVFNGRAQTGAEHVSDLVALGARWFRIEFVDEHPTSVKRCLSMYSSLLEGRISGLDLWRELKLQHQLGVTRGPQERS